MTASRCRLRDPNNDISIVLLAFEPAQHVLHHVSAQLPCCTALHGSSYTVPKCRCQAKKVMVMPDALQASTQVPLRSPVTSNHLQTG